MRIDQKNENNKQIQYVTHCNVPLLSEISLWAISQKKTKGMALLFWLQKEKMLYKAQNRLWQGYTNLLLWCKREILVTASNSKQMFLINFNCSSGKGETGQLFINITEPGKCIIFRIYHTQSFPDGFPPQRLQYGYHYRALSLIKCIPLTQNRHRSGDKNSRLDLNIL